MLTNKKVFNVFLSFMSLLADESRNTPMRRSGHSNWNATGKLITQDRPKSYSSSSSHSGGREGRRPPGADLSPGVEVHCSENHNDTNGAPEYQNKKDAEVHPFYMQGKTRKSTHIDKPTGSDGQYRITSCNCSAMFNKIEDIASWPAICVALHETRFGEIMQIKDAANMSECGWQGFMGKPVAANGAANNGVSDTNAERRGVAIEYKKGTPVKVAPLFADIAILREVPPTHRHSLWLRCSSQ